MPEGGEKAAGILRDDFASMQETVERRYRRLQLENKPFPSLILIDGGIGQLHAAAKALEKLAIINQPMASIAKKEEILYILGREDEPVILDHHSPVLHLIQQIRDETHRFAVSFHRQRRSSERIRTSLTEIVGVGNRTAQKLLRRFGSVTRLKELSVDDIAAEVPRAQAQRVYDALHDIKSQPPSDPHTNSL
jgi:excinuclease ABC subunit C